MSDEYDNVARGKLKLKSDSGKISKKHKKNKKNKDERVFLENPSREKDSNTYTYEERVPKPAERQLTKAEMSFKKMQVKMVSMRLSLTRDGTRARVDFRSFIVLGALGASGQQSQTCHQRINAMFLFWL